MSDFGKIKSFGDITDWYRMERPYIAVFQVSCRDQMEDGVRFTAKLYDGEYYTGYHMLAQTFVEIEEDIEKSRPERKPLHPLSAPFGRYFRWMNPPEFFCIVLKKHRVEDFPETVDIEILQRILFPLEKHTVQIAASGFYSPGQPQGHKRRRLN